MTEEEKRNVVQTGLGYRQDIERTTSQFADIKEQMEDELESMPEYTRWKELADQASNAKKQLDIPPRGSGEYNVLPEHRAQLLAERRDQQAILSNYVVSYAVETKESQLELEGNGDALPIILKGKLGKPEKYQTNLFSGKG